MNEQEKTARLLRRSLLALAAALLVILACRLLFVWLLPFTLAFLAALILSPLSRWLGRKTRMSSGTLRLLLLLFTVSAISLPLVLGVLQLVREAKGFFSNFYDRFDSLIDSFFAFTAKWEEKLSLSDSALSGELAAFIRTSLKNAMNELSLRSATFAAKLAGKLPSMLFALLLFLLALFYFSYDYDRITAYLSSLIPPRYEEKADRLKSALFTACRRYLRAYCLLFLITFSELYLAFVLLKVDYAALLALLSASLDILPAVGVGIVLIPWALLLFIGGNTGKAIAVLLLYLGVTLLRQIIEPRILSAEFGVHPLVSLIALYLGFRLFGVAGILLSPFAALLLSRLADLYRRKIGRRPPTERPPSKETVP